MTILNRTIIEQLKWYANKIAEQAFLEKQAGNELEKQAATESLSNYRHLYIQELQRRRRS